MRYRRHRINKRPLGLGNPARASPPMGMGLSKKISKKPHNLHSPKQLLTTLYPHLSGLCSFEAKVIDTSVSISIQGGAIPKVGSGDQNSFRGLFSPNFSCAAVEDQYQHHIVNNSPSFLLICLGLWLSTIPPSL